MNQQEAKDYKFGVWDGFGKTSDAKADLNKFGNTAVRIACESFEANFNRVTKLSQVITSAFVAGGFCAQDQILAGYLVEERKYKPKEEDGSETPEGHRLQKILKELEFGKFPNAERPRWSNGFAYVSTRPFDVIQRAFCPQAEAIMFTQMTGGWTAFETLCGDLWESAANVHPIRVVPQGKRLRMAHIAKATNGTYDLKDRVGTIMRARMNFMRLTRIQDTFKASFRKSPDIDAQLACEELVASTARNCILHKAAIMDQEYEDHWKDARSILPPPDKGKSFPIDGEVVARVLIPVRQICLKLIFLVDAWISNPR